MGKRANNSKPRAFLSVLLLKLHVIILFCPYLTRKFNGKGFPCHKQCISSAQAMIFELFARFGPF